MQEYAKTVKKAFLKIFYDFSGTFQGRCKFFWKPRSETPRLITWNSIIPETQLNRNDIRLVTLFQFSQLDLKSRLSVPLPLAIAIKKVSRRNLSASVPYLDSSRSMLNILSPKVDWYSKIMNNDQGRIGKRLLPDNSSCKQISRLTKLRLIRLAIDRSHVSPNK